MVVLRKGTWHSCSFTHKCAQLYCNKILTSFLGGLLLSECNNINDYRTGLLNHFPKGSIEQGHKIIVISFDKKDTELNWLLNILIRSYHLSSVSSVPLTSDLSYAFFLFLWLDVVPTINRQVAQKRYCIVVFVYDNGKETEWGRGRREREKRVSLFGSIWKEECAEWTINKCSCYSWILHKVYLILKHKNRVS